MHPDKKRKKILSCNEKIRVIALVGQFALFCWCIRGLRKCFKKDKRVNIQDKTGKSTGPDKTLQNINTTLKKKVNYNLFQKKLSPKETLQKRPRMPITYLILPNKIKPSKKSLTKQKSAHLYTTQKDSPLFGF